MSAGLYRFRAQECTTNAEQAIEPRQRANWLSMASKWLRLASEVEGRQMDMWGVSDAPRGPDLPGAQELSFASRRLCQH